MIAGNENLSEIFSIFHDGIIDTYRIDGDDLELEVEIHYLAERVDSRFTKFFLRLQKVRNIKLETWPKDANAAPSVMTSLPEIFGSRPDILSGELKNGSIEVSLNQDSADLDHCGGTLTFEADAASVFDEGKREYKLDDLRKISEAYWTDWENKNKSLLNGTRKKSVNQLFISLALSAATSFAIWGIDKYLPYRETGISTSILLVPGMVIVSLFYPEGMLHSENPELALFLVFVATFGVFSLFWYVGLRLFKLFRDKVKDGRAKKN